MFAVIFEVIPVDETKDEYLEIAGKLRNCLQDQQSYQAIMIRRFSTTPGS